jgi:high-affinity nickel-transport protein
MRSLVIGVVHGLAGSGALTALVMAELPTTAARLGYMALFGIGSVGGMALLSGVAGFPMAKLARRPGPRRALALATGALSLGFGLWWLSAA